MLVLEGPLKGKRVLGCWNQFAYSYSEANVSGRKPGTAILNRSQLRALVFHMCL